MKNLDLLNAWATVELADGNYVHAVRAADQLMRTAEEILQDSPNDQKAEKARNRARQHRKDAFQHAEQWRSTQKLD